MLFRSNDAVDGGDYVGEILGGITFTLQPQSQTVTIGSSLNWTSAGNLTVTDGWLTTIGNNAFAYALDKKWEMIDGFYGTGYYYGDLRYAAASTVGNLTTTNQTTFGGGNWTTAADVPTFATNGTTTVFHAGETLTIATTDNRANPASPPPYTHPEFRSDVQEITTIATNDAAPTAANQRGMRSSR